MRWPDANSRFAVSLRRLRRRFGISAPKVAVKTHVSWYWRAIASILVLSISIALAGWLYDVGHQFSGTRDRDHEQLVSSLKDRIDKYRQEILELRAKASSSESSLQVERTAQQQLMHQVRTLEQENTRLKEDLAFFENFSYKDAREPGFTINGFKIEAGDLPGHYRFRLMVAIQGGKKEQTFRGNLQLVIKLRDGNKDAMMIWPAANDPQRGRFNLNFRYFQRVDGGFQVPQGARPATIEARFLQDGVTKASRVIQF